MHPEHVYLDSLVLHIWHFARRVRGGMSDGKNVEGYVSVGRLHLPVEDSKLRSVIWQSWWKQTTTEASTVYSGGSIDLEIVSLGMYSIHYTINENTEAVNKLIMTISGPKRPAHAQSMLRPHCSRTVATAQTSSKPSWIAWEDISRMRLSRSRDIRAKSSREPAVYI